MLEENNQENNQENSIQTMHFILYGQNNPAVEQRHINKNEVLIDELMYAKNQNIDLSVYLNFLQTGQFTAGALVDLGSTEEFDAYTVCLDAQNAFKSEEKEKNNTENTTKKQTVSLMELQKAQEDNINLNKYLDFLDLRCNKKTIKSSKRQHDGVNYTDCYQTNLIYSKQKLETKIKQTEEKYLTAMQALKKDSAKMSKVVKLSETQNALQKELQVVEEKLNKVTQEASESVKNECKQEGKKVEKTTKMYPKEEPAKEDIKREVKRRSNSEQSL